MSLHGDGAIIGQLQAAVQVVRSAVELWPVDGGKDTLAAYCLCHMYVHIP